MNVALHHANRRGAAMAGPTQAEKRELFERHFLLGRLNSQEIDALLAYTRMERYPAGREIFCKDSPGDSLMAVLKGRVKIRDRKSTRLNSSH